MTKAFDKVMIEQRKVRRWHLTHFQKLLIDKKHYSSISISYLTLLKMEQTGALTFLKETLRLPYFFFILNVSAMEFIISIWVLVTLCWNNFRFQLLSIIGRCAYYETFSHKIQCSPVFYQLNLKNEINHFSSDERDLSMALSLLSDWIRIW